MTERKRMVHEGLFESSEVNKLTVFGKFVFLGMILLADDHGRFQWSAPRIRSFVFPVGQLNKTGDEMEDVPVENVAAAMKEIAKTKLVCVYKGKSGESLAHHPNWKQYQWLGRPAKSRYPICSQCDKKKIAK